MTLMLSFLKTSPAKKLQKEYEKLLKAARDPQRQGKLPEYGRKTAEAEKV
jgi:hypothetical protein